MNMQNSELFKSSNSSWFQLHEDLPDENLVNLMSDAVKDQVDEVLRRFNIPVSWSTVYTRCQVRLQ